MHLLNFGFWKKKVDHLGVINHFGQVLLAGVVDGW
jgi:hypothetical protein